VKGERKRMTLPTDSVASTRSLAPKASSFLDSFDFWPAVKADSDQQQSAM
jgi:hypothetical protein